MIIYKATNKINGKMYIGQTISTLKHRMQQHLWFSKKPKPLSYFHCAIKKYGRNNFSWEIICVCKDMFELNKLEIYYIDFYNSFGENGYNLNNGGTNALLSEKHKKKISEAWSEERKEKKSKAMNGEKNHNWGKKASEETKKKLSKAMSGNKHPKWGTHHSEETKKKLSEANKGSRHYLWGKHPAEKTKKKMSLARKGIKLSEETKKKLSISKMGNKNPMYGKRGKDCFMYGRKLSDEVKKNISISKTGKNSPVARAIMIGDKYFDTQKEASEFVGITPQAIRYRIPHKTRWMDYKYV